MPQSTKCDCVIGVLLLSLDYWTETTCLVNTLHALPGAGSWLCCCPPLTGCLCFVLRCCSVVHQHSTAAIASQKLCGFVVMSNRAEVFQHWEPLQLAWWWQPMFTEGAAVCMASAAILATHEA
jgi:hypothetical protein